MSIAGVLVLLTLLLSLWTQRIWRFVRALQICLSAKIIAVLGVVWGCIALRACASQLCIRACWRLSSEPPAEFSELCMACDAFADTPWCTDGCCVHRALVLLEQLSQSSQVGTCSWQAVPLAWVYNAVACRSVAAS